MFRWLVVLVVLNCAFGLQKSKHHGDKTHSQKIVGGQPTTVDKHPYQVSLITNDGDQSYICGGSIISNEWILTAAHCLENIKNITVRVGSSKLSSGGTTYTTSSFKVHPSYSSRTHDYDIAVVNVPSNITFNNSTVKAVKLAAVNSNVAPKTKVTVSGWGTTRENGMVSDTLRDVTVPVVSRRMCNTSYQFTLQKITTNMLCAGNLFGGKDSCQGDSGGPLVLADGTQVGVVSFGNGCARPFFPGVYADVGALRSWIQQTTGI